MYELDLVGLGGSVTVRCLISSMPRETGVAIGVTVFCGSRTEIMRVGLWSYATIRDLCTGSVVHCDVLSTDHDGGPCGTIRVLPTSVQSVA